MKEASDRGRITELRTALHSSLLEGPLKVNEKGIPGCADSSSKSSIEFAAGMIERMGNPVSGERLIAQASGKDFEIIVREFIYKTFAELQHIRPGRWEVQRGGSIVAFEQYAHLNELDEAIAANPVAEASVGRGYIIKPDILVLRKRLPDEEINSEDFLVDAGTAVQTSLREANGATDILHACISCKWTMRSDRAQNARSEGLTLVKNRAGHLPHIAVVTAEPMPGRLSSLAYGTGEIDMVYHVALPELGGAVEDRGSDDSKELMVGMIQGNRLRDISDLPLDLAV